MALADIAGAHFINQVNSALTRPGNYRGSSRDRISAPKGFPDLFGKASDKVIFRLCHHAASGTRIDLDPSHATARNEHIGFQRVRIRPNPPSMPSFYTLWAGRSQPPGCEIESELTISATSGPTRAA